MASFASNTTAEIKLVNVRWKSPILDIKYAYCDDKLQAGIV